METEDGYVIKYINNDLHQGWFYSLLDENGEFIPSDILVKYPAPNDLEIPKHLREISPRIRNLNYHPENINAFQYNHLQRGIASDTLKPLVLLVEFDDKQHTHSAQDFSELLFTEDLESIDTGLPGDYKMSVRDYYDEISNGKQAIIGDLGSVADWEIANYDYNYYVDGVNGTGTGEDNGVSRSAAALIVEIAMKINNSGFEFTSFEKYIKSG